MDAADDDEALLRPRPHPFAAFLSLQEPYALTRFVVLRWLGFVYLVAFLVSALQFRPLIGAHGLLPAVDFLARVQAQMVPGLVRWPTLFWLGCSDGAIAFVAWSGVALSVAVLCGVTNAGLMVALWALYFSLTQIGQVFYGYGWETLLCETGFLAVFLCPLRSLSPFAAPAPPPIVMVLLRWLGFRILLGAGFIKLRGDPCWRDLTCLAYHYETQPVPNPLSWWLHSRPLWFHQAGVAFNHLVEVVAPWFAFGPRRARLVAGVLFVAFQVMLIMSGNLSFLNWLTIVPALGCFDDRALMRLVPSRFRPAVARRFGLDGRPLAPASRAQSRAAWAYAAVVAVLSTNPIVNLLSDRQAMNATFEPLRLVNTYGAFGSVGKERYEVILEGTSDEVVDERTAWREYELPCKPGDPDRRPCVISPYHYRLDWQLWFAAFSPVQRQPWIVHLVGKLLLGDRDLSALFARDPFPDAPPRFVRARLFRYRFTRPGEGSRAWWVREPVDEYLPPLSRDSPELSQFLRAHGWADSPLPSAP